MTTSRRAAPRTICAFDNLELIMCDVFHGLSIRPTHILSTSAVVSGFEALTRQQNAAMTYFKNIPIYGEPALPANELHFMRNGEVLAIIDHIS